MRIVTVFYINSQYHCTHVTELPNVGGLGFIPVERWMAVNFNTAKNVVLIAEQCEFPADKTLETYRVDINSVHIQYLSPTPCPVLGLKPVTNYIPKPPSGRLDFNAENPISYGTSMIPPRRVSVSRDKDLDRTARNYNNPDHNYMDDRVVQHPRTDDQRVPWVDPEMHRPINVDSIEGDAPNIPFQQEAAGCVAFLACLPYKQGPVHQELTRYDDRENFPDYSWMNTKEMMDTEEEPFKPDEMTSAEIIEDLFITKTTADGDNQDTTGDVGDNSDDNVSINKKDDDPMDEEGSEDENIRSEQDSEGNIISGNKSRRKLKEVKKSTSKLKSQPEISNPKLMGAALKQLVVEKVELAKKLERSNLSMADVPDDAYADSKTLVDEVKDKLTELSQSVRGKGMKNVKRVGKHTRRPSATPKSRAASEAPSQIEVVQVKQKHCRLAEDEKPEAFNNLHLHIQKLKLEKM